MKTLKSTLLILTFILSACDGTTPPANSSQPNTVPSAENSATPNESSENPSNPSVPAETSPNDSTATPGVTTALKIMGAEVFDAFSLNFREGMQWTYVLKAPSTNVQVPSVPDVPGIPSGFEIPGVPTGAVSADLGEQIQTVTKVEGNTITLRVELKPGAGSPLPATTTESSFENNRPADLYSSAFAGQGEGTLTWSAAGKESVTVGAGTYMADKILGVMDITTTQDGVTAQLKQDITMWMAPNVGWVKQETKTQSSSSGVSVDSTTVIELKSFQP